jgi:hypothetical protein
VRGIPERLHRNGKAPVPIPSQAEVWLYRRVSAEKLINGGISELAFDIKGEAGDSTSRSDHCLGSEDARYTDNLAVADGYESRGEIAQLAHDKLTQFTLQYQVQDQSKEIRSYTFEVEHTPTACIYPHCDIWILRNGSRVTKPIQSKAEKRALRQALVALASLCPGQP